MTDPLKSPQGENSLHWPLNPHSCLKSEKGQFSNENINVIASRCIVMYSKTFRNFSGFDLGQDLNV